MKKFDEWNDNKKEIHKKEYEDFYINVREIWFTKMWINVWFEENWKSEFLRPVLVLKKVWNLFFTVALTSQGKEKNYFYYKIVDLNLTEKNKKYINSSYCILSQVRVMDKKRFSQNVWNISNNDFIKIQKRLKNILF